MTERKPEGIRPARMVLRLRLGSARRFAALLLLLGVMLGGAVDAIACEPTAEIAAVEAASADPGSHEQLPDDDRHGACVHGHCHHGAQQVPQIAAAEDLPIVADQPVPSREHRLASITPDLLKRPPRA
ncbi:MAG TPA: hypothetical protein VI168_08760 [Croceibacterium sp.]